MPTIKKYLKTYKSRALWGKLRVSRMLLKDSATASLIPTTRSLSLKLLILMLARYKTLYIKPNIGSLGMGIHRLSRYSYGDYELISVVSRKQITQTFSTIEGVYLHLKRAEVNGKLIIQRGVSLDLVGGKPYDLRTMVQRRPNGPWTYTGTIAKIASPNRIVTNVHQGAQVCMVSKLWEMQGLSLQTARAYERMIESKALAISRSLSRQYTGMYEMGIDFAFDRSKKLWVIEVNTNHPEFGPVKKLDRATYNRMASYARSYGRMDH
ncbi:YheC/D like ATP-grasp [Paenibacillaceae bacterium GAS479]|nr:YheC/D like ATP-grasp [Paenibacillaceae bacterium GAS479]